MACKRSAVRSRYPPPEFWSLSSRGLGHNPFTVGTGVRIPLGTPVSFVWNLSQNLPLFGGLAQLGERLHGMQEVSGSIPLSSTRIFGLYRQRPNTPPFHGRVQG